MKRFILISLIALSFMACADHVVVTTTEYDIAEPVVVDHGIANEIIGVENIVVDTIFPYPGRRALGRLDLDEVTCDYEMCIGSYTALVDIVERSYEITVDNEGSAPAYGLWAGIRVRIDEPDPYDPYATIVNYETVDLYMADMLEPGWGVTVSYLLYDNEEVLEFLGIEWDEYDVYAKKLKEDGNHYAKLAKKGSSKRIKVEKNKL